MLNRPTSSLHNEDEGAGMLGLAWQFDRNPLVRLALLFAVIVGPLAVVGWRVGQLQIEMSGVYASEFSRLTEQIEEIPCLDGNILTADGQIAAGDVPGLEVQVHYRWIEEPPDPRWLKQKVLARIPRGERRKPERIQAETDEFLAEREALWKQLADATGVSIAEFTKRRAAIQSRVDYMKKRVERRRALAAQEPSPPPAPATTWTGMAQNFFVEWIAQTPEVKSVEPIVLKEELSYYPLVAEITPGLRSKLKMHPELYPNLRVVDVTHREYPLGSLAAHVVGYRKPLTQEEWEARQARLPQGDPLGYLQGDRIGQTGIERFHERHLKGVRGQRKLWLNSQGEIVNEREIRAARPGQDVELTLNLELQRLAEQLLKDAVTQHAPAADNAESTDAVALPVVPAKSGCIAVMDVRTGEMLVAASWPTFDINVYLNGAAAERQVIETDPRFPLYPRLHKMMLAPGSVFKALTATAMLQGGIRADTPFHCQGFLHTPNRRRCLPFVHHQVGHGEVNMSLAMAQSCNVYFFQGAEQIGAKRLLTTAAHFGFGQPTGVDLPDEKAGNLPALNCDHLGVAIGQAALTVTPLQIVRMMGAIANGGELLTPRLARRSGSTLVSEERISDSASTLLDAPKSQPIPDLSPHTLETVRHGLEQVVAYPRGTGHKSVYLKEIAIAGKTGTAESRGGPDHAWFSGYVPADRPRYALVVVLERGGSGGKMAGPLAKKLVQGMLRQGVIEQSREVVLGNDRVPSPNE